LNTADDEGQDDTDDHHEKNRNHHFRGVSACLCLDDHLAQATFGADEFSLGPGTASRLLKNVGYQCGYATNAHIET
jgi:hypothetical protein